MKNYKYIVVEEPVDNLCADIFQEVYDTASEATREARYTWEHLTSGEQKKKHVYSAVIYSKYCETDDDGNVDWYSYTESDNYNGCFDSNVWYAVIYSEDYAWDFGSHLLPEAIEMAVKENFHGTNSHSVEIAKIDVSKNHCDKVFYI